MLDFFHCGVCFSFSMTIVQKLQKCKKSDKNCESVKKSDKNCENVKWTSKNLAAGAGIEPSTLKANISRRILLLPPCQ